MATLVLTAVGTALGGPIGGAVGALIGRSVDARLFRPAPRDGPRLTELALQTSSYGTQIPRLFGTMRVAGTVIWATDLIETRSTEQGGKGQPSTASYSYAASFAVLLSARPIRGVKRIWAEGKLLRGAAGDWKARTGFRLHLGTEDQAVDPLIGSAEGACPAYRGCAYAVFEGLQLADFGNRIPSLTFEVAADEGALGAGAIARELAGEVSGDVALAVDGFAAAGGSVAAVLATLGAMSGAWWGPAGAGIAMRDEAATVTVIADDGVAAAGDAVRRTRSIAALETVPQAVAVSHYDAARDYQTGVQRARRPGPGTQEDRIEAPAVLSAAAAKAVAHGVLARAEAGRVRRTVAAGLEAIGLAPGACVRIDGEAGVWRIVRASVETMVTMLDLTPVTLAPVPVGASGGRVLGAPDVAIGRTVLHAFETPALGEAALTMPRLSVVAAGEGAGWRRAALLYSLDDGTSWVSAGTTAQPATIGAIEGAFAAAPATLIDRANAVVVRLLRADMTLGDADAAALDRGANLALVGEELIQFARAVPLGARRWLLRDLLRGRRGTEAAAGRQAAGDRFVLIEPDGVATIDLPASAIGRTVRLLASGIGDEAAPAAAITMASGASVTPPAPVRLTARRTDGALIVEWTRRSRLGWRWTDGIDVPLGEEREAYLVTVTQADGERRFTVEQPWLTVAAVPGGVATIVVRQQGTIGLSPLATLIIEGE